MLRIAETRRVKLKIDYKDVLCLIGGAICLWAGIRNSEWMFGKQNAPIYVRWIPRPVLRAIMFIGGLLLVVGAILSLTGVIKSSK